MKTDDDFVDDNRNIDDTNLDAYNYKLDDQGLI